MLKEKADAEHRQPHKRTRREKRAQKMWIFLFFLPPWRNS